MKKRFSYEQIVGFLREPKAVAKFFLEPLSKVASVHKRDGRIVAMRMQKLFAVKAEFLAPSSIGFLYDEA